MESKLENANLMYEEPKNLPYYDALAFWYNAGSATSQAWVAFLEKFILQSLPEKAHFLDICCGKGELIQQLIMKGYQATGLDFSKEMLHYARENVPNGEFIQSDARFFKLPPTFHAVVSTQNSFSNVTSLEELTSVFYNVYAAMLENGWFAFDLSQEEEYILNPNHSYSDVQDDFAFNLLSRNYYPEEKIYRRNVVLFRLLNGNWQRSDVTLVERPYSPEQVKSALEKVGFKEVKVYDVNRDLAANESELTGELDGLVKNGRMCYVCHK